MITAELVISEALEAISLARLRLTLEKIQGVQQATFFIMKVPESKMLPCTGPEISGQ